MYRHFLNYIVFPFLCRFICYYSYFCCTSLNNHCL